MTHKLTIEYRLEGRHPGYQFTGPTDPAIDKRTRKAVWQNAIPRGQGWRDARYAHARTLKVFDAGPGQMAASVVHVTDMTDEMGRGGIRRAKVTLMDDSVYHSFVRETYKLYPETIRRAAEDRLMSTVWRRVLDKALLRAREQIVLAYPYRNAEDWKLVEALVLRLVSAPGVRWVEGWGTRPTFTTLSLDWREEGRVVALPLERARSVRGVPVIEV